MAPTSAGAQETDGDDNNDSSSNDSNAGNDSNAVNDNEDMEDDESGDDGNGEISSKKPLLASKDGFYPGSILRVKLEYFITYERAEFVLGPHLNMIIGPNGTGKSALVCAICLGLGFSPKHLGRASQLKEFVKHGHPSALIEIELQAAPPAKRNPVVRVRIRRANNTQEWSLNGRPATGAKIRQLTRSLRIQVDNLCQFLPQDRVVEFSAYSPVNLFKETLRAAAPRKMRRWQEDLASYHRERKLQLSHRNSCVGEMRSLQAKKLDLQADVDKAREREDIQARLRGLRAGRLYAEYHGHVKSFRAAKARVEEVRKEIGALEKAAGPLRRARARAENRVDAIGAARNARKGAVRDADLGLQAMLEKTEELEMEARKRREEALAQHPVLARNLQNLLTCASEIGSLEMAKEQPGPESNLDQLVAEIRLKNDELYETRLEKSNVDSDLSTLHDEARTNMAQMSQWEKDMDALDTTAGRRLGWLKKYRPHVAAAVDWLLENKGIFAKEVYLPPLLCCTVREEAYADIVESFIEWELECFTVQTREDLTLLNHHFYDKLKLRVTIRSSFKPMHNYGPPMGRRAAAALGIDGFAINYIDGPEPVRAMLCSQKQMHRTGVSLGALSDEQVENLVKGQVIRRWGAKDQIFAVFSRREYGTAYSISTMRVRESRFWKGNLDVSSEKAELEIKIEALRQGLETMRIRNNELKETKKAIAEKEALIVEAIDDLKMRQQTDQQAYNEYHGLPDRIESEKRQYRAYRAARVEIVNEVIGKLFARFDTHVERAASTVRLTEYAGSLHDGLTRHHEGMVHLIEAAATVRHLIPGAQDIEQRLAQAKQDLDQAKQVAAAASQAALVLRKNVVAVLNEQPLERARYEEMARTKTVAEIDNEIEAHEAMLEIMRPGGRDVISKYEDLECEILKRQKHLEGLEDKLDGIEHQVNVLRAKWEPRLDALVGEISDAFSYNFDRINCAGEIRVQKEENFDEWALEILVKFRESEDLHKLDRYRQSGGERAVTTIFFLLSLQSMARSPFRVVDEINQGMDPRNERLVHERMVEIACREHASQYFLITPKLLRGLHYDGKMRVLCIASGEQAPDDDDDDDDDDENFHKLDVRKCLAIVRQQMAFA